MKHSSLNMKKASMSVIDTMKPPLKKPKTTIMLALITIEKSSSHSVTA